MKPLTIGELKGLEVGDWVWIVVKDESCTLPSSCYYQVDELGRNKDYFMFCLGGSRDGLLFSSYGKTWLAYKNKEQAEAKGDIMNYETKYNALKTAVIDVCYSLDDKAYRNEFYNLRIGSRVQHIEKLADQTEARLQELRGEK